jgi:uncharacterized repeat protein (TIGR01451 family)
MKAIRHLPGLLLASLAALLAPLQCLANGASYATAGTGTFTQSLAWLDFAGYKDSTAAAGGQAFSFTLPNGVGTLTTTVLKSGSGTMVVTPEPAWPGGGAIGHGAYNGISGSPIFYWLTQPGNGTVTLSNMVMKDAAGIQRSFSFYATDGENTNGAETITYASSGSWSLLETINYYALFNGGSPNFTGLGTSTVVESAPTGIDGNYNAAVILSTQNPSQVAAAFAGNEAALFAVSLPTVTFNLSLAGRLSATDQFKVSLGYTSPPATIATATTSGTGTSAGTGTISVIGTNSVTVSVSMVAGSASPISNYVNSVACTNSGPGAAVFGGTNTVLPSGAGTSFSFTPQTGDAITCTLTLKIATQTVSGTVYNDANANANLDAAEAGTGIGGLYVKLATYTGGACQTPALAAAAVNASTGAYTLPSVSQGSYCLSLTNSASLSNTTPVIPSGWIGTQNAAGTMQINVGAYSPAPQNFGLYNGAQVAVQVYGDTGTGGGTANDGVKNGGETGLAGVTVNAAAGASVVATAVTDSSGNAVLWLPAANAGSIVLTPVSPTGYLATGGSAGSTAGSYARPSVTFTFAAGAGYTGVAFGLVPPNSFTPNGSITAQPGTSVFFAHSFTAGSAGQATFTTTASPSPGIAGWSEVLYRDVNCSGQFASGDPVIAAPITAVAQQQICVLVKEFVPANAPANAQNTVTVSASFAYAGSAAPGVVLQKDTDNTIVVGSGPVQLTKLVQNVTQGTAYGALGNALPGNTLQYQLTIFNQGSAALSNVVIDDATPAFTSFLAAACPAPAALPAGLTSCSVSQQPAAGAQGALAWTFTGTLAPGAQTAVTYKVQIAQ